MEEFENTASAVHENGGANVQDIAAPDNGTVETTEIQNAQQETNQEVHENSVREEQENREPSEQSKETNAIFAQMRRKAEAESELKAQRRVDNAYAEMFAGKVNPYTNHPIKTEKDYKDYVAQHIQAQRESQLKNSGLSQEMIQSIVNENPVVKQAKEIIEKTKLEEGKRILQEQISEISKLDGSIKEVSDLFNQESYQEIDRLVNKGLDLVSAFKLANYDRLTSNTADSARNEAVQKMSANAQASPGSLAGGENQSLAYENMSAEEFEKYVQKALRGELSNI